MNAEFLLLSDKITQLAALTQSLRLENTGYRLRIAELTEENAALAQRIEEAAERVQLLLEQLPAPASEETINEESVA